MHREASATRRTRSPRDQENVHLGRNLFAALVLANALALGLGLLAGRGDAALPGTQDDFPTPPPTVTPEPAELGRGCKVLDGEFHEVTNYSSTFGQVFNLEQDSACGYSFRAGAPYSFCGTFAATSGTANQGGTVRIQITSPNPGSPGYEFQQPVLGPVPQYPDFILVPFCTPPYVLPSPQVSLSFIFQSTSGLYIPYDAGGHWPLWRYTGSWAFYNMGTVLNDLRIYSDEGASCYDTYMPAYLPGTITGAGGATFGNQTLTMPFEQGSWDWYATQRDTYQDLGMAHLDLGPSSYLYDHVPGLNQSLPPSSSVASLYAERSGCGGSQSADATIASPPAPNGLMMENIISAQLADGREFGQIMPSFTDADALPAGSSALFPTTQDGSRYRVNAGVMAVEDDTVVIWTPVGPIGTSLAAGEEIHLAMGQATQINDVATRFALGNRSNFMLQMTVTRGAALGYVSVLDGKGSYGGTSDPTTVLPVTPASRVTLLEVGAVSGVNQFSGSAIIANHSARAAQVRADFYARGSVGVTATNNFTLAAGEIRGYGDVVGDLVGQSNVVGTLVLTATNGTLISAIGREFAVYTDSHGAVTGTAGQLMPGLTDDDILSAGGSYDIIGLIERQTANGPERSHLGAFNPGSADETLTAALFSATNAAEGSITRTVHPGELLRINNIVSAIDPGQDGTVKRLRLTVSGPMFVLGYRVNATGDPVTLQPFRR